MSLYLGYQICRHEAGLFGRVIRRVDRYCHWLELVTGVVRTGYRRRRRLFVARHFAVERHLTARVARERAAPSAAR